MDVAGTLFNNLIPDVREFFISEAVQVPQRLKIDPNHQGKQRLLLFRNATAEAEKYIITIKAVVQPAGGSLHCRKFMIMTEGSPSIKTADLSRSFQYE